MLFDRQRDVELVDAFAARRSRATSVDRAEQRQAAVADGVAVGGAVVHETRPAEAELAVLEHAVGDQTAEIAGADDQHALEADACAPAPPEQIARRSRARCR